MKTTPEDCTLLLVGGGSVIAPATLKGVGEIMFVPLQFPSHKESLTILFISLPPFHSVANAVGAAIANVSGEIDTIEILEGKSLPDTIERLKQDAIAKAIASGADPETTRIAEVNVLPVQVGVISSQSSECLLTMRLVCHKPSHADHCESYR